MRRFRAIILTTVSTVGGLAPLIVETDFQARFLIPMALSHCRRRGIRNESSPWC